MREATCIGNGQAHMASHITKELCQTLNTMHDPMAVMITEGEEMTVINNHFSDIKVMDTEVSPTVDTVSNRGGGLIGVMTEKSIVRRLTPLECTRLQGFPDGWVEIGDWTDSKGKLHKDADSPKYKALGNSIALPFWEWMARRICDQYDRPVTMGSLFDGIGGFPLVFERAGGKAVWASEIEEFPIAVTKERFKK